MNTNENGSSLDESQKEIARSLVLSGLTPAEFFESSGITEEEWQTWLEDEDFISYASSLAEKYAHASEPFVWSTLLRVIKEKDNNVPAIRLFLSIFEKKKPTDTLPQLLPDRGIESLRSDIFGEDDTE